MVSSYNYLDPTGSIKTESDAKNFIKTQINYWKNLKSYNQIKSILPQYSINGRSADFLSEFNSDSESQFKYAIELFKNKILFTKNSEYWGKIFNEDFNEDYSAGLYYQYCINISITRSVIGKPNVNNTNFNLGLIDGAIFYNTPIHRTLENIKELKYKIEEIKGSIDNYIDDVNDKKSEFDDTISTLSESLKTEKDTIAKSIIDKGDKLKMVLDNQVENIITTLNKKSEEIKVNKDLFNSISSLWGGAITDHQLAKEIFRNIGIFYGVLFLLAIFLVYNSIINIDFKVIKEQQFILIFTLTTALAVVFWIGRLISKSYTTHQHLEISAKEKKAFIETYITLISDNNIKQDERIIMLQTIFKPSSDGLVKEEASPSSSFMEAIARQLSK